MLHMDGEPSAKINGNAISPATPDGPTDSPLLAVELPRILIFLLPDFPDVQCAGLHRASHAGRAAGKPGEQKYSIICFCQLVFTIITIYFCALRLKTELRPAGQPQRIGRHELLTHRH